MPEPLKILIVDDSRIFRAAMETVLPEIGDVEVIGSVPTGEKALQFLRTHRPDLVTLDVEMPGMNGIQTLEAIQAFNAETESLPAVGVIMVSAFTLRGAEITIRALELGAFDFIAKPQTENPEEGMIQLRQQLKLKLSLFSLQRHRRPRGTLPPPARRPEPSPEPVQPCQIGHPRAILLGVSTGGPKALIQMLPGLSSLVPLPMFIVQHMPPTFTRTLAESLDGRCRHRVVEAAGGERVQDDHIYLAPGGSHLILRTGPDGHPMTAISEAPPENGCRPSVDVLFRSAPAVYGGKLVAIILTGMGSDGSRSLPALKRVGARILAQNEETSVVWGMPGSAVATGCCDDVLPLEEIPARVAGWL